MAPRLLVFAARGLQMSRLRRQGGFSVAEMVIVIALSSVTAASVVPVASTILNHHRLQTASREVAFEIARARMQAIGQNSFVRIVLEGNTRYARERSTDGATWVRDGSFRQLPRGVTLAAGDTGTPRFDRQGIGASSTVLTVSGSAGTKVLFTSILGRVKTQ